MILCFFLDTASVPFTPLGGNIYSFDIGDVGVGESGSFWIKVDVSCDTELGQTLCVEAYIFPDTICAPPAGNWDGSSISVSGSCEGDQVRLRIQNVGVDMSASLKYIIFEDNVMMAPVTFQLDAGQSIDRVFLADGTTYRLESDQADGHPGFVRPTTWVEGCGEWPFSTGFVTMYPENDNDPFLSTDCQEVRGAYDPNDKQAAPKGYDQLHYVELGVDLDYHIRFQNTGTAPAVNVIIIDTLDKDLDPASLIPGASSHPYEFQLFGNGIVQFKFSNIMLPDSNANEPESHGFVKFRIKQKPGLEDGAIIENAADIYFDFNAPIRTNTTFHTIGSEFVVVSVDPIYSEWLQIDVYPNPFTTMTTLQVKGGGNGSKQLCIIDMNGGLVKQMERDDNRFELHRGDLAPGIYFFTIYQKGVPLGAGKIIVQ